MQLIDPSHSFYQPLWRRVVIVAVCLGWAVVETTRGDPFWAVLTAGAGIYSAWVLLVTFKPAPPAAENQVVVVDDDDDGEADNIETEKRDG